MTAGTPQDKIVVEGLEIECVLGLYEHERAQAQRIVADFELTVNTESAALLDRLDLTVDYEWVTWQVVFLLKLGRFRLLEAAAGAICRALLLPPLSGELRGPIEAVRLRLHKPLALGGRGQPRIEISRSVGDFVYRQESKSFGTVDVVYETPELGVYRLGIAPGQGIEPHIHRQMQEAELILSSGLSCAGSATERGSVRVWPLGCAHAYENSTELFQSVLCLDRPSFLLKDEIAVEAVSERLCAIGPWDM